MIEQRDAAFIGGEWKAVQGSERIDVINPATEEVIANVALADQRDVDDAVQAASTAFASWSRVPSVERSAMLESLVVEMRKREQALIDTITAELGVPTWFCDEVQVKDPIDALANHVEYTALMDKVDHIPRADIVREPVGVSAQINPWNYPLSQIISKAAPALAAGCTVVTKASEVTPLHAFLVAEAVAASYLPKGVFNMLTGTGMVAGEAMCRHPLVDMVSFTGSRQVGVRVSQVAAESIKRVCLELGGKSPYLITDTQKLEEALRVGVEDLLVNTGQSCNGLTRFLLPEHRYEEGLELIAALVDQYKVGDPTAEGTFLGPVVSDLQRSRVRDYIRSGIAEGARLITGGPDAPEGLERGYYVKPTVFADVTADMKILNEEIFGPVLCVQKYKDEADAIRLANEGIYGLSARVWHDDEAEAIRIGRQIRAGQMYINHGEWNNAAPFGGFKQSGNGRELGAVGLDEYIEYKSIQYA